MPDDDDDVIIIIRRGAARVMDALKAFGRWCAALYRRIVPDMPAAAWIALIGCVLTVFGSGFAAWVAVRVGQARDSQRIATLESELVRLRDSVHEERTRVGTAFLELGTGIKNVQLEVARLHGRLDEGAAWRSMVLDLIRLTLAEPTEAAT